MTDTVLEMYKIIGPRGYSCGGKRPRFTNGGKTWRRISHVLRHLEELSNKSVYESCALVSLKYDLKSSDITEIGKLMVEADDKCRQRIEDRVSRSRARQEREEIEDYKRLCAESDGFLGDPD